MVQRENASVLLCASVNAALACATPVCTESHGTHMWCAGFQLAGTTVQTRLGGDTSSWLGIPS